MRTALKGARILRIPISQPLRTSCKPRVNLEGCSACAALCNSPRSRRIRRSKWATLEVYPACKRMFLLNIVGSGRSFYSINGTFKPEKRLANLQSRLEWNPFNGSIRTCSGLKFEFWNLATCSFKKTVWLCPQLLDLQLMAHIDQWLAANITTWYEVHIQEVHQRSALLETVLVVVLAETVLELHKTELLSCDRKFSFFFPRVSNSKLFQYLVYLPLSALFSFTVRFPERTRWVEVAFELF